SLLILAGMAALMPFALYALKDIHLDNRIETWLPAQDPHAVALEWFHTHFGDKAGLLISWEGASLNDPRVEAFAAELAGLPDELGTRTQLKPGFSEVRTPRDLIRRMLDNNVDRDTAITQLLGVVIGAGPLKIRLTPEGRLEQDVVVEEIRRRAREQVGIEVRFLSPEAEQIVTSSTTPPAQESFQADEYSGPGADDPYPLPAAHDFQMQWAGMTPQSPVSQRVIELSRNLVGRHGKALVEDAFYAPGAPVAVMLAISDSGDEGIATTIADIRAAAVRVGIPEAELHMGGSPYGRYELNRAAQGSMWNTDYPWWNLPKRSPVMLSAIVGVGLAFLVLKSTWLATLILLTDIFVAVVTMALLPLTGHTLNMVLIVMPNLLIVLTSSGAIHIANYWKHAADQGKVGAVLEAIRIGWKPCALASVTTAIGLASLVTSILRPVREFGIFASIGCLISLAAILIGFPAMLRLWKGPIPAVHDEDHSIWRGLGRWLARHGTSVVAVNMALICFGAFGLQWFRTETKVIKYFKPTTRIYQDYQYLEENLAGIAPVEVVVSFSPEVRDELATAMEEEEFVEDADDEPIDNEQSRGAEPRRLTSVERMELVRKIKSLVAGHPEISGTLALSDFRPPLEVPPADASIPVRARYGHTVRGINNFLAAAEEEGQQSLVSTANTPLVLRFSDHTVDIPPGAELWRVRAQVALMTDLDYSELTADLERAVAEVLQDMPGTSYVVTGMVPLFLRTQNAVVESLIESFGLAFLVISVMMMIMLRNPVAGMISMFPNVQPIILVFGIISLAGVPVDIGTMITASVALGIAVDGTLHLLTWFREGIRQGLTREEAISLGLAHCGPAMWQTSAAIGLGLLMLIFADLLLVSRFGWLMAAMIAAALYGDIVFLPALLAGSLGTLIARTVASPASAPTIEPPESKVTGSVGRRDKLERPKSLQTGRRG
ncbi:MAG: MMPL family transporter, partial [Planctomycetaceae bacterium]|nr:MMPL family transporter [Planctomycetaceae bacterium]